MTTKQGGAGEGGRGHINASTPTLKMPNAMTRPVRKYSILKQLKKSPPYYGRRDGPNVTPKLAKTK